MKRKALWRSFLLLVLSGVLLALSVYASLAWLSAQYPSGSFGFGSGKLPENTLQVAILTRTDPTVEPTEDMRTYYPCEGGSFLADHFPTINDDGETYAVELSDLSFGIIDNVARIKPENRIFLCLKVPKENGDTVDVKLYYGYYGDPENGYFADIYRNTYDEETGEALPEKVRVDEDETVTSAEDSPTILDCFHAVEGEDVANDCYLSFSLLVTNEEIPADELAGHTFYGANGQPAGEGEGSFYKVNAYTAEGEGITVKNEAYAEAEGFYYVYVCIEPNLAVFGYSIEYISGIMPCYLFFKVNAAFTVYQGE